MGLEYILQESKSEIFNLGNGNGFSVKQIVETARNITGKKITAIECDRRPGDPPILVGSGEKAKKILGWKPQYADISSILSHAWQWHKQRHGSSELVSEPQNSLLGEYSAIADSPKSNIVSSK